MKRLENVTMNVLDSAAFQAATKDCEHQEMVKAFEDAAHVSIAKTDPVDVTIEQLATTGFKDDEIPRITFNNEEDSATSADFYAYTGGRPHVVFSTGYDTARMFWMRAVPSHKLAEVMVPDRSYAADLELDQLEVLFCSTGRHLTCLIRMHEKHSVVGGEAGEIREGDFDVAVVRFLGLPSGNVDIKPILVRRVSMDCISYENLFRTAAWCARFWNGLQSMMHKGIYDA